MNNVVDMEHSVLPVKQAPADAIEEAWVHLFAALVVLREESHKRGFANKALKDDAGRLWSVAALARRVDSQFSFVRKAVENAQR